MIPNLLSLPVLQHLTMLSLSSFLIIHCMYPRSAPVTNALSCFLFRKTRVAVVGNVDAGKSTLLGVLTHGELDNGRGMARQRLFRHKHEMESGRTSSVGNDILGFDSRGDVVNKPDAHGKSMTIQ